MSRYACMTLQLPRFYCCVVTKQALLLVKS
jgi:hypothetical protein